MKLRDMTIKIMSPLALMAARPLTRLLNEIADRERAEIEAQVEERRRDLLYEYESGYYGVPVETLRRLDAEIGILWRMVVTGPNKPLG